MLDRLIQEDQKLFLLLNGWGNKNWDSFWLLMTDKLSPVSLALYVFLLGICLWKLKWKHTVVVLITVALMITLTDQIANMFKYGFERLRPCHDELIAQQMRLVKASCGGKYGYFSAHAANSFAVATFFALLLKPILKYIPLLLVLWALLVAYSRVYIGVHYPLDVITGISVGMITGWLFFVLFNLFRKKIRIS